MAWFIWVSLLVLASALPLLALPLPIPLLHNDHETNLRNYPKKNHKFVKTITKKAPLPALPQFAPNPLQHLGLIFPNPFPLIGVSATFHRSYFHISMDLLFTKEFY